MSDLRAVLVLTTAQGEQGVFGNAPEEALQRAVVGRCPFHREQTPRCTVFFSEVFHCRDCDRSGAVWLVPLAQE